MYKKNKQESSVSVEIGGCRVFKRFLGESENNVKTFVLLLILLCLRKIHHLLEACQYGRRNIQYYSNSRVHSLIIYFHE